MQPVSSSPVPSGGFGTPAPLHQRLRRDLRRNRTVYLLMLLLLVYYALFKYLPITKMIIAFQDFSIYKGISGSKFVGLENFVKFFRLRDSGRLIANTLRLSLKSIVYGFPAPIIFALMLNEVQSARGKRVMQTVSYLPHFISLVVVCGIVRNFCSSNGVVNQVVSLLNPSWENPNLLGVADYYDAIHICAGLWQETGWGSIIYLATLSGVDPQLYEAAYIDGASRLRRIWHITLPALTPVIVVKLIMRLGDIMSVATDKILLLYNPLTYSRADTISTYMYRYGLLGSNYSMGAAISVFNTVISIVLLVTVNRISRRLTEESLW